jgi:ferredoxin-NADP reductase
MLETLEVVERRMEAADIVNLRLRRQNGKPIPVFKAGQFLTVQIGDDKKTTRSYSISSSAANRRTLQIAVKQIKGGVGSTYIHQLQVGSLLKAYGPSGHFVDPSEGVHARVYVAGGIGITPLYSMLQSHVDTGHRVPIYLFYGARTKKDLAFHEELTLLQMKNDNFHYIPVLSEEKWEAEVGFVGMSLLQKFCNELASAHVYMCGPSAMMDALTKALGEAGLSSEQIHSERFVSPVDLDKSKIPHRRAQLTLNNQVYQYDGKETLLDFFEGKGVAVSYSCRVGVCGTCKCSVTGKVTMLADSGLTVEDRRQGLVLSCVAFPEGDGEVRFLS